MRMRSWPLVVAAVLLLQTDAAGATLTMKDAFVRAADAGVLLQQQRGAIRGRVTADTGEPLELVQVSVVGTTLSVAMT
jgi:hypothetical protein